MVGKGPKDYGGAMTEAEFLSMVEIVLELQSGSLELDVRLDDVGWDSLAVIGLIAELDRQGGPELLGDAIASATSVRDLYQSIFGP